MIESKEKILAIALYYFLKKPYTEVTMNEILKTSGLSKGGFYHHFPSKEALYHEVIDRFILQTFSTEYSHYSTNPYNLPFVEFVPFYLTSTLEHLVDLAQKWLSDFNLEIKIEEVNLYMVMFDMMKHYTGFDKTLERLHDNEINMFKALIDIAKRKGEIKNEIDSLVLANHVHTLMHGVFVLSMFDENMENLENKIKQHFDNLYQLIKN